MITMNSNIGDVTARLAAKFQSIQKGGISYDKGLRAACASLVGDVHHRIHQEGKDSQGNKIGTYSNPYLRVREANNRNEGTDIIFSLTRGLENGFTIVVNASGVYGVGWVDEGAQKVIKEREAKKSGVKKMKPKKQSKIRKSIGNSEKFLYLNEKYPLVYIASDKEKARALRAFNEVVSELFK